MANRVGQQNKRFQADVYKFLEKNGPQTCASIVHWFNNRDNSGPRAHLRARLRSRQGITSAKAGAILSSSTLFEKDEDLVEQEYALGTKGMVATWKNRDMDDILERAIKSRRDPCRYPNFVAVKMREIIGSQ